MTHASRKSKRVLAVDPAVRGLGFVVLEGRTKLVDWGVKEARSGDKNARCLRRVEELIAIYWPQAIVVEGYAGPGSRRCRRVERLIDAIERLSAREKLPVRRFSRAAVRKAFAPLGAATKHEIAQALAARFPELAPRLPPFRKPWMSEDYRMSIFDAAALGWTYFRSGRAPKTRQGDGKDQQPPGWAKTKCRSGP